MPKFKMTPLYQMYYNEDSCFGVYSFETKTELEHLEVNKENVFDDESEMIYRGILSGKMQKLTTHIEYECDARLNFNKKYSKWQYEPISITAPKPEGIENQKAFLKAIVTERQAEILLNAYPNIVQDIIDNKEIDLSKTKGIKDYTFNNIKEKIEENYVMADILIMLSPLGVSLKKIKKLSKGEPNIQILKKKLLENPYILTNIDGLGFDSVDKLALKLNPPLEKSKERVIAFVNYCLNEIANSIGHTWVKLTSLNYQVKEVLPECKEFYKQLIKDEKGNGEFLYFKDDTVGLKKYYNIEQKIFDKLKELNNVEPYIQDLDLEKAIKNSENKLGFELTDEQKEAVKSIETNNVIVVTASAGAGKTTVISAIIEAFKNKATISLCALSAKAAQRMKEVTGYPSSTIHRLLSYSGEGFTYNKDNPLIQDLIVVDEASMINCSIFLSLIDAIKLGAKLIIVFDFAQLPPIGAGNVASDLLSSDFIKINKFTKVHRQAEKSGILVDANKIRKQINPLDVPESLTIHGELKDMIYKFRDSREALNDLTIKAYLSALKDTNIDNLTIITPRKKECINSAREINKKIQDIILKDEKMLVKKGEKIFKLGAKVIQRKNDYDKNVVNGEIGYVCEIIKDGFIVKFDEDKFIEYTINEMDAMELAYTLTIHSSQGSQWDTVICVIDFNSFKILDKCLLYTAITRASKRCMLIAEPKAFKYAVDTDKSIIRQTYLKEMITEKI